jgi:PilZ domain-containing protein
MRRNTHHEKSVPVKKLLTERRRWPRLPLAIPVFVRGSDGPGKDLLEFATILNVGAGGVLMASRKLVRPGSRVSLEIPVSLSESGDRQNKLQARVLRAIPTERCYLCAARFKSPLQAAHSAGQLWSWRAERSGGRLSGP